MKKLSIKVFLILSLISNCVLGILLFNTNTYLEKQETLLENAIVINEFSERAKEWRNFNDFIRELSRSGSFPVSDSQSDVYWELAKPMESVVLKSTDYVLDHEHSSFILTFDETFEDIIDTFKEKLPLINQEQLIETSKALDDAYRDLVGKGEWGISLPDTMITMNFQQENLDSVIEKLNSIHFQLLSVK
ncbi:hypothetical protein [Bacillus sp. SG-1]|uniref:hypothetical protein n=1 Tax=Bacillus sp. SG-1 TaxID=161544 RepID=UPI0003080C7F|nr:hypothetical protein [Bacillus sp. SG-1]